MNFTMRNRKVVAIFIMVSKQEEEEARIKTDDQYGCTVPVSVLQDCLIMEVKYTLRIISLVKHHSRVLRTSGLSDFYYVSNIQSNFILAHNIFVHTLRVITLVQQNALFEM
jgi:hypothetical protein